MDYIMIAFLAAALSAGVTLTDKFLMGRAPIRGVLTVIAVFGFLSVLIIPGVNAAWPTRNEWLAGTLIGLLFSLAIYSYFRGLRVGEVSRLAPLSVLSTVLITLSGVIIFGDTLTLEQSIAIALFVAGSFLLVTRFEHRIEIFDYASWKRLARRVNKETLLIVHAPVEAGMRFGTVVFTSVRDASEFLAGLTTDELIRTRLRKRLRLVPGFWWYLASVLIAIPYTILAKELNLVAGPVTGFVAIRVGMALGCTAIVLTNINEIRLFSKQKRIIIITSIKEIFGALTGFLALYAFTLGPLGIIRSILSMDTVIIFIGSTILAFFGVFHEIIERRTILQKGIGIICMIGGTVLLFR